MPKGAPAHTDGVKRLLFEGKGKECTAETARLAVRRARELGIRHIVAASNTGYTADEFLAAIGDAQDIKLVVVTHHIGFHEPGEDEMAAETRARLTAAGCPVLTTTHLFANVERAITSKFGGLYPGGIISATLRLFGQGTKVCLEIATMAMDAGLIPAGHEVVAAAGSGKGADTALVLLPAHARSFFETQVREVICKPRSF